MKEHLLTGLVALFLSSQAQANVVYNYVGNSFAQIVDNTLPSGTYDTSMRITGFMELDAPLLAGMPLTDIGSSGHVLNFSFSDGRNTISGNAPFNDPLLGSAFHFGTNAAGVIDSWEWEVAHNGPIDGTGTDLRFIRSVHHNGVPNQDLGFIRGCIDIDTCFNLGQSDTAVTDTPGSWTIAPVNGPIPEPETYVLMLSGLGLLGFAARRRKHEAA